MAMSVCTAYVALVLRWCNVPEALVQYQSDGRDNQDIQNSIGYFTTPLYLNVRLKENDDFVDLMKRVTEAYCSAYEYADGSYFAAKIPRPEFKYNTVFNWIPDAGRIDLSGLRESEGNLIYSPFHFVDPIPKRFEFDHEPIMLIYDTDDDLVGEVHFSLARLSCDTMQRFVSNFQMFINMLLANPGRRVKEVTLM